MTRQTRLVCLAAICLALAAPVKSSSQTIDFSRDIRPLLSNNCFKCHGPDDETREAELRLDTLAGATMDLGGYQAIKPGDPQASAVFERITATDADLRMPPADSGLSLSTRQIEVLRTWIAEGAEYETHWAFRPIVRPRLPQASTAWSFNPIDTFVWGRLHEAGLQPSPEAERPTLIRRVHLDLLGLPPTPEEVHVFVGDLQPGAYERMVERVLASPHYGERWGRHWLDQARYADTNGYTVDSERSIWPFRDWVIGAVNADMPFDQFTIEQLAGDLLPNPTQEQLVATGFHRNTLINQEGGTDREQFRNEAVVDRVNTTGAVWLGLTVGCAQCHTHKYDPLTQREYYQLFAFFNSSQDVNSTSPTINVALPEQQTRLKTFDDQIASAKSLLAAYDKSKNAALPESERDDGEPVKWMIVTVDEAQAAATFEKLEDGSLLATGDNADSDSYSLTFRSPVERITGLRLETLTHPTLPQGGPGRAGNGNFVLSEVAVRTSEPAMLLHASADHSQKNYDVGGAIDGDPKTGWAINTGNGRFNVNRTAEFAISALDATDQAQVTVTLTFGTKPAKYNIGRFRLAVTDAPHAKLGLPDVERARLVAEAKKLEDARAKAASAIPSTMIMRDLDKPRETHVLIRGDFLRHGDQVKPGVPAVLPPMAESSSLSTRLELAKWLSSRDNPLTARVTVNRSWVRFFGEGLVETENDFGLQGTPPTHPELLDWLSAEFMESGWSMKHLHRLIVSSATYRQSSVLHAHSQALNPLAVDPLNKLLGRQNRLRVDAEVVRDLSLAVGGLLDREIGGKSVYPPQPDGVYAFTQRNAAWPTSTGADRYRRGMYTFFMRSAPYPMLTTFDTPRFNATCTRRVRSNTPLQSLTMANDQAILEHIRALGERVASFSGDDAARIDYAYRLCFARNPAAGELESLTRFVQAQRDDFAEHPDDAKAFAGANATNADQAPELATWTAVARILLNLDEFITRE